MNRTKKPAFSEIQPHFGSMKPEQLIPLLQDLWTAFPEIRSFLSARFLEEIKPEVGLKFYRLRIVKRFTGLDCNLPQAQRAIEEYWRATGDREGVLELQMTFMESAVRFLCRSGDMDEPFYDGVEFVLADLTDGLKADPKIHAKFRERLLRVAKLTEDMGWGFGDFVRERVYGLEDKERTRKKSEKSKNPARQ